MKKYNDYFSFTFVRNPFDLIVSLYFYIRQSKSHKYHMIAMGMEFPEFVSWYLGTKPERQLDFLCGESSRELIVNYVGKYESLSEDLLFLKERLGLQHLQVAHKNKSIKKTNNYQEYYDNQTKKIVQEYFKDDLARFGYSF